MMDSRRAPSHRRTLAPSHRRTVALSPRTLAPLWRNTIIACAAVAFWIVPLAAAELTDAAASAFAEYGARARQAFIARVPGPPATNGGRLDSLRDGQVIARAGGGDGIMTAPDSLIHHWFAATWVPGVTVDQVLAVSRAYGDYPEMYKAVIRSQVLSTSGDTLRILLRLRESAGGLTATLDVRSTVTYSRIDAAHAYAVSSSDEVREVQNEGKADERLLPPGRDSGYLWRAASFTRFVAVDGGVYVEMETLGLSRRFPRGLGWMIEPIARRLGRRSAENSVQEFRAAILKR